MERFDHVRLRFINQLMGRKTVIKEFKVQQSLSPQELQRRLPCAWAELGGGTGEQVTKGEIRDIVSMEYQASLMEYKAIGKKASRILAVNLWKRTQHLEAAQDLSTTGGKLEAAMIFAERRQRLMNSEESTDLQVQKEIKATEKAIGILFPGALQQ